MQVRTENLYSITLTEKEYQLLYLGIGNTSPSSREAAGMSKEQAEFFSTFFSQLPEPSL